jgi:uncharacterized protein (TIGR00251 family)
MQVHCLVKPKCKTDAISVNPDGSLRIKIKALPVDGRANEYLVKFLAEIFNVSKSSIRITSGFTNSHKRINIVAEDTYVKNIISKLKSRS